jgi:Ca2+-transporting ATPase
MSGEALRVLGLAYKTMPTSVTNFDEESLENDLTFMGLMGMIDPPREEAMKAVEVCRQIKIKSIMITGDHKLTAMTIAKEVGIYNEGDAVLTGEDLERMSDKEFEDIVEKVTVYARVSPSHKLKIVEAWKKKGQTVAMTGDGVNDAPALKHADIGVAMGLTGTEVTKEASDLVLADDNFAKIVNAIEVGRWIYDNIKKYLTYLLQANLVEIMVLSIAVLAGYPPPLLPVQILYINLATDGLPAVALGLSPSDPDVMKRPPRNPKETIFTKEVKSFLLRAVLIEVPLLLWVFLSSLPQGEEIAQTRLFIILVFFELVLTLTCRSLKYTLFKVRPHKFLLLAVLWEAFLILALINIPVAQQAFGIAPIGIFEAELVAGLCLVTLLSIEITKHLLHADENRKSHKT